MRNRVDEKFLSYGMVWYNSAMLALKVDGVSYAYATDPVFTGLTWEVHDDRVAGLVGPNGCGKSTLLKLMAGELIPDEGYISRKHNLTIGYLPQEVKLEQGKTVWQVAFSASEELSAVETALEAIEAQIGLPEVYENATRLGRAMAQQQKLVDEYDRLGGANYSGRVKSTLRQLGFTEENFNLPVEVLSGGQRKLVALSRLLITQPGLLVLDEPDNHLDLEGKEFLERLIREYEGGVVIVSHDRYLLDLVVDEIVELENNRLEVFNGNYSEFVFDKQLRLLRQQQLYNAQQSNIRRLEQSAKRLLMWGQVYDNKKFSRRGKNILKRLEIIKHIDRPILDPKRMQLDLGGWVGSAKVLEIEDLCLTFPPTAEGEPEASLFQKLNLLIMRGERVGLVGPNGAGKSYLFRLILGQDHPDSGDIRVGPSVKIGYYAQQHETLDYSRTLVETVCLAGEFSEDRGVAFLKRFLFGYRQAHEKVATLSGGERSRLQLALVMLSDANFLLLDEPTNNLDIYSTEVLENSLDEFEGTVLIISHDRYFIDRVVERIVELDNGQLKNTVGNYSDYQALKFGNLAPKKA
jgi:ATP-binding cassette, subfamily F, member 3